MLLMTISTVDRLALLDTPHSYQMQFASKGVMHTLTSSPEVGDTAIIVLKTDLRAESAYFTKSKVPFVAVDLLRKSLGLNTKNILQGTVQSVVVVKGELISLTVHVQPMDAAPYYVHYFGIDPYVNNKPAEDLSAEEAKAMEPIVTGLQIGEIVDLEPVTKPTVSVVPSE